MAARPVIVRGQTPRDYTPWMRGFEIRIERVEGNLSPSRQGRDRSMKKDLNERVSLTHDQTMTSDVSHSLSPTQVRKAHPAFGKGQPAADLCLLPPCHLHSQTPLSWKAKHQASVETLLVGNKGNLIGSHRCISSQDS